MPVANNSRITIEPGKRGGKPCVRGLRITVWDVLGWLGAGMTEDQILYEHPDLEKADFPAIYQFARRRRTPRRPHLSLLLDENLSSRLVPRLASLFPGIIHLHRSDGRRGFRGIGKPKGTASAGNLHCSTAIRNWAC